MVEVNKLGNLQDALPASGSAQKRWFRRVFYKSPGRELAKGDAWTVLLVLLGKTLEEREALGSKLDM
jgi:hypothetical protein